MLPITVVIADRQPAHRAACLRLLRPVKGVRVVGEAGNGFDALAATRLKPRILLLDLTLSLGPSSALLPVIRRKSPGTKVILLTDRASDARILDALAHGVPGYLERRSLRAFLAKAVRLVDAGEGWVPRQMVTKMVMRLRARHEKSPGR
ncbi:MAG TPA: response regulator [Methylomirabilota bacterium]|jgi:DNA-binding NarL/FixJ family response regulator|nr:response regulator [Methylomirabilota bacterium]